MWDLTNNSLSRHQAHTLPRCLLHLFNVTLNSWVCHFHTHVPDLSIHFWHFQRVFFPKIRFYLLWNKICRYWWKPGHKSMTGASTGLEGAELSKGLTVTVSPYWLFFFFLHFMGPWALLKFCGDMKIYKITQSENSFSVRFLQLLETRWTLFVHPKPPFTCEPQTTVSCREDTDGVGVLLKLQPGQVLEYTDEKKKAQKCQQI